MNTIIPLNDLTARFALTEKIGEDVSKKFINDFFELIESSLANGEIVTVKDLGTFVRVDSRVAFTPDEAFAARANEPFAMFSPVELDEAAAAALEAEHSPEPEESDANIETTETDVITETHDTEVAAEVIPEVSAEVPAIEESPTEEIPNEETAAEETTTEEPSAEETPAEDIPVTPLDETQPETAAETQGTPETPIAQAVETPVAPAEETSARKYSISVVILWAVVALIVGFAAGALTLYLLKGGL